MMDTAQLLLFLPPAAAIFAALLGWIAVSRSAARVDAMRQNAEQTSGVNPSGSPALASGKSSAAKLSELRQRKF